MNTARTAAFLTLLCAFAGCGKPALRAVSGTVTYAGQPLPAGVIWFDPEPTAADSPQGFAYIKNGRFDTREKGRSIRAGNYLVRVEGFDGKPGNELPMGRPLFTDFQEKRDIPDADATLAIEVPAKKK